ncbi:phosphopantetheine-binding protein [Streptomyces sp. NPDC048057]|uniref:phosphopantetheine-binding protein n=1 Tax=Streptomyces sp. NPDC048057 TaxID=3155628 RepID=UPI00340265F8
MDRLTAIREFVTAEFLPELTPQQLDVDYDLVDSGVIDSLGLYVVLAWLNTEYDLNVHDESVQAVDLRSVSAIVEFVERSRGR